MITRIAILEVEEPFAISVMDSIFMPELRSMKVIFFYMIRPWLDRVGQVGRVSQHDALATPLSSNSDLNRVRQDARRTFVRPGRT
jgi:hypothetical protein